MLRFVSTSLCPYCGKPALRLRCVFAIRGFIENASRGVERVQGGGFGHRSAFLRLLFALAWQAAKNAKKQIPRGLKARLGITKVKGLSHTTEELAEKLGFRYRTGKAHTDKESLYRSIKTLRHPKATVFPQAVKLCPSPQTQAVKSRALPSPKTEVKSSFFAVCRRLASQLKRFNGSTPVPFVYRHCAIHIFLRP